MQIFVKTLTGKTITLVRARCCCCCCCAVRCGAVLRAAVVQSPHTLCVSSLLCCRVLLCAGCGVV
jgi:hypothetical protein